MESILTLITLVALVINTNATNIPFCKKVIGKQLISYTILMILIGMVCSRLCLIVKVLTANKLTNYTIKQLERKVDRCNSLIPRINFCCYKYNQSKYNKMCITY